MFEMNLTKNQIDLDLIISTVRTSIDLLNSVQNIYRKT